MEKTARPMLEFNLPTRPAHGNQGPPMKLFSVLIVILGFTHSPPLWAATNANAPVAEVLLRIHFAGTRALAGDPNAAKLNRIFALPATQALAAQTAGKLARAWPVITGLAAGAPAGAAALFRPLLADLAQTESLLEWRAFTNGLPIWTLAVRLDEAPMRRWQSNLTAFAAGVVPGRLVAAKVEGCDGWLAKNETTRRTFGFVRAGEWLVIGAGHLDVPASHPLLRNIKATGRPVAADGNWLSFEADLPALAGIFHWPADLDWPQARFTVMGRADNLRTLGSLTFPRPMRWPTEPWHVPTNTIQDPLISFTALKGLRGWLANQELAKNLEWRSPPDQLFLWAQSEVPFQTYLAWPAAGAAGELTRVLPRLQARYNPRLKLDALGEIRQVTSRAEVAWQGLPIIVPFIRPAPEPGGDFLLAGIFPTDLRTNPPPPELMAQLTGRKGLLYYDWEITESRLAQWRQLAQLQILIASRPPVPGDAAADRWLEAVGPLLGNTVTEATVKSPAELAVVRQSHLGLTGFELLALARWLDEPGFPFSKTPPPASGKP